ncbi:MAG: sigma-70 family RNA polymerase sigma factor [Bacillota bacterium]|nr:sigma-70 family RNA polymerase sigma factor [Bacillota bacterium]
MNRTNSAEETVSAAIEKYADMVRRICFLQLKNSADVEDVFQDVFLKYYLNSGMLQEERHQKAWLCRVTYNKCKDMNKSVWSRRTVSINDLEIPFENEEESELMAAVLRMSPADKNLIYLHYFEGLTIPEIAEITRQKTNTVYSQLRRARGKLKREMGELS